MLTPLDHASWALESIEGAALLEQLPDGTQRALLARLRVERSPDGAVRRARDLLPSSRLSPTMLALPERLGGGQLFVTTSIGTSLWRARDFLGPLQPLARVTMAPLQVTTGPDRLLLRALTSERLIGIDPETGALGPALPLPTAPRFGPMAFADAYRGMVWADLAGLLVTHDAGASWQKVPINDFVQYIEAEGDSFLVLAQSGARYRFDALGTKILEEPAGDETFTLPREPQAQGKSPLGDKPLRAVVEEGWPISDDAGLLMRGGRIAQISLTDGRVLALSSEKVPGEEDARCQAVRFGVDVGFVCGAPGHGTSVYAWRPPLSVTPIARFDKPRAVMPSGNGWLVVRGPCDEGASVSLDRSVSTYCVLSPRGARREVVTRGDVGVERVVALADGRVAVVVPPRGSDDGLVTILPAAGGDVTTHKLSVPELPAVRRGLWLDGMTESQPEQLSGWVSAGGVLFGVRLDVRDGTVLTSSGVDEASTTLVGPYAFSAETAEAQSETHDGGFTWQPVTSPPRLGQGRMRTGMRCSMVGCALPFERFSWLRVGWGAQADPTDLEDAAEARSLASERFFPSGLSLTCAPGRAEGPTESGKPRATSAYAPARRGEPGPFMPFFDQAPPVVAAGNTTISDATYNGTTARLYSWIPKGTTTARAGRFQARFLDKFTTGRPIRSTLATIAPWADEQTMLETIGGGMSTVVLHGFLDPSGKAAMLAGCRGGRDRCDLFGLIDGRALLALPEPSDESYGRVMWPTSSMVWFDEVFYVSLPTATHLNVYRVDASQARLLTRVPRAMSGAGVGAPVTLVKRALGRGLGLLARGVGTVGVSEQNFYVLPIDPDTGEAGELVKLVSTAFSGMPLQACAPEQDGWLADVSPGTSVLLRLPGNRASDAEFRVRLEPDRFCIESIAARLQEYPTSKTEMQSDKRGAAPAQSPLAGPTGIPMVATAVSGRRIVTECQ